VREDLPERWRKLYRPNGEFRHVYSPPSVTEAVKQGKGRGT